MQEKWTDLQVSAAAQIWREDIIERFGGNTRNPPDSARLAAEIKIAEAIGRSLNSVRARRKSGGCSFVCNRPSRKKRKQAAVVAEVVETPQRVTTERDQRINLVARDTTALLMGDPLPGRSALDQKLAAQR